VVAIPTDAIGPGLSLITGIFGGLFGGGRSAAQVCQDTKRILTDFIEGKRNTLPWFNGNIKAAYTRRVFNGKAQANCGNIFPNYDTLIAARLAKTGPLPDDVDPGNDRIPPEIRQSNQTVAARTVQSAKEQSPFLIGVIVAVVIGGLIVTLLTRRRQKE